MILVVAEQRDGELNRASWEDDRRGAAGRRTDQRRGARRRCGVRGAGARRRRGRRDPGGRCARRSSDYTADGYVAALQALIAQLTPALVFLPHTYQTRDFAPALAARLGRPLVTDVVAAQAARTMASFTRGPCFRAS